MAWVDNDLIIQGEKLFPNGSEENLPGGSRKVCPPHGAGKKGIP